MKNARGGKGVWLLNAWLTGVLVAGVLVASGEVHMATNMLPEGGDQPMPGFVRGAHLFIVGGDLLDEAVA